MYKVTNKTKDPRKLRINGADIIVGPGSYILTSKPLVSNDIWEVKLNEEQIEQIVELPKEEPKKQNRGKKK
jgi:hypothetical protein